MVGVVEGGDEVGKAVACAGEAVRLKGDDDAAVVGATCSGEGGANLFGMVSVVVDDEYARGFAFEFEAAFDALKRGESGDGGGEGDAEFVGDGDDGEHVADVVFAEEAG